MKSLAVFLLLAAGALVWVLATRGERTFERTAEEAPVLPAPTVLVHGAGPGQVERDFDVAGMCCKNCTGKLFASVTALPGVREAAVDFDTGLAQVVVDAEVDPERVRAALSFGKYSATPRGTP